MTRLIYIITKKTAFKVSIPFFIELIFLIISLFYTSQNISLVHSLWFTVSVTILTLYLAYDCLNFYYLGNDSLLHIMPFSNERLLAIKSCIALIILWLYSFVGFLEINLGNNQSAFTHFSYFGIPKLVSLASFFMLFSLSLLLIKPLRTAKVGLILCLLIHLTFMFITFFSFMSIYGNKIQHWIIGLSSSHLVIPIYTNILQIELFTHMNIFVLYTTLFNFSSFIMCLLLFIIIYKKSTINYLTLTLD